MSIFDILFGIIPICSLPFMIYKSLNKEDRDWTKQVEIKKLSRKYSCINKKVGFTPQDCGENCSQFPLTNSEWKDFIKELKKKIYTNTLMTI